MIWHGLRKHLEPYFLNHTALSNLFSDLKLSIRTLIRLLSFLMLSFITLILRYFVFILSTLTDIYHGEFFIDVTDAILAFYVFSVRALCCLILCWLIYIVYFLWFATKWNLFWVHYKLFYFKIYYIIKRKRNNSISDKL
jgi:hypothetical protein